MWASPRSRAVVTGSLLGALGAAVVTALLEVASEHVNVLSLAVCYQLLVLVVSGAFGVWAGLVTGAVSVLAFNFFFIPPVHTLSIADSRNWVSFAVFAATAIITANLAAGFRRQRAESDARRRDAELLAGLARTALSDIGTDGHLERVAAAAAAALGVEGCALERAEAPVGEPSPHGFAVPLESRGRRLGTLRIGPSLPGEERWSQPRFPAAVASIVSLAVERAELMETALETESLRRSDEMKTALLRGVSHEFRTPLTALRTAGEALAEDPAAPDAGALIGVIRDEGERLDRLVANLLDMSRLEAGALEARVDWCDPTELAAGALDAAAPLLGGASVAVEVHGDPPLVRADAGLSERIIVNLLHNAVRHGAPPVRLDVAVDGDRLEFRVSDAGPGPDASVADRLFAPFVSGPQSGGAGVGLALARGLAEAQGGRLDHGRRDGRTEFTLSLPLTAVPEVVEG